MSPFEPTPTRTGVVSAFGSTDAGAPDRRGSARAFNALLYRHGMWLPLALAIGAIPAFWPRYFSKIASQPTYHGHAHGLVMLLWFALIIAQPWLIRAGRRATHRRLGKLSYLLVPLIVLTTIDFIHLRVRDLDALGDTWLYALALVLNALVVLVAFYAMALYHRRNAGTHARWMVCTLFPLFTPVTDRLIGHYVPALLPLFPQIGGEPLLPIVGFAIAELMLIGLAVWDWRANRRADVFPAALVLLAGYHVSVFTFHRFSWWAAFGDWFAGLRLG